MHISHIQITTNKSNARLEAFVKTDFGYKESVYVEVPIEFSNWLRSSAEPFIAAFLIPCMRVGENLTIEASIDETFSNNIASIQKLVCGWNIGYKHIEVEVKVKDSTQTQKPAEIGTFFSGGVDSFYTYLLSKKQKTTPISTFLFVTGFDIGIDNIEHSQMVEAQIKEIADAEDVNLVTIKTNVRNVIDQYLSWDYAHGSAMAFVSHSLSNKLKRVYFSGGAEQSAVRPYGLHPELDPLWSNSITEIIHTGIKHRRIDKVINFVSKSPTALKHLRVCWKNKKGSYNCSHCEKCIRTMIALEAAGVLDQTKTFTKPFLPENYQQITLKPNQIRYHQEAAEIIARNNPTHPLIKAVEECSIRSQKQFIKINDIFTYFRIKIALFDLNYGTGVLYRAIARRGAVEF